MEKIYSPEFIPYYVDVVKEYKLNDCQALVYWFVRFYTAWGSEFWFKNEQLWVILNRSEWSINCALWVLEKKDLIYRNMIIMSSNGSKRKIGLVTSKSPTTVTRNSLSTVTSKSITKENIKENINNIKEEALDLKTTAQQLFEYYKAKFWTNKKAHKRAVAIDRILARLKLTSEPLIIKAIDTYFTEKDITEPQFVKPCENFFWNVPWTKHKFIDGFLDDIKDTEALAEIPLEALSESQLRIRTGYSIAGFRSFREASSEEFWKLTKEQQVKFKELMKKVEDDVMREIGIYQ